MVTRLLCMGLFFVKWVLSAVGVVALVLTAMLATPLQRPPELSSISETVRAVDRSTMPPLQRFSARDGSELAYRHYPARGAAAGRIAILVHGSSGSSVAVHALADALAARGVATWAPDIRGHGGSGTRGDIGYLGQLEHDLADLVALVRKTSPEEPLTLLGHSAGGVFAIYALEQRPALFQRIVAASPAFGTFSDELFIAEKLKNIKMPVRLDLSAGEEENSAGARKFYELLNESKPPNLEYRLTVYKSENHNSVRLSSFPSGLYWVYGSPAKSK